MVPAGGWQKDLKKSIRDNVQRPCRNSYTKRTFEATSTPNSRRVHTLLNPDALVPFSLSFLFGGESKLVSYHQLRTSLESHKKDATEATPRPLAIYFCLPQGRAGSGVLLISVGWLEWKQEETLSDKSAENLFQSSEYHWNSNLRFSFLLSCKRIANSQSSNTNVTAKAILMATCKAEYKVAWGVFCSLGIHVPCFVFFSKPILIWIFSLSVPSTNATV